MHSYMIAGRPGRLALISTGNLENDDLERRLFDRRCRGYEAIGYRILLPASVRLRSRPVQANSGETSPKPWRRRAIPGWPADVVLPSDPVWKRDYSGSVQRLVRHGVDIPLARMFLKDQLLQENGYFVLRCLVENVGRNLDLVLEAIMRVLSHRRRTLRGDVRSFRPCLGARWHRE